jgi:hypothetical protein
MGGDCHCSILPAHTSCKCSHRASLLCGSSITLQSFDPYESIGSHKLANISSTCLFLWVHVYLSRMGSNGFVIPLLWLSWIMYTILTLATCFIPKSNMGCYIIPLHLAYFFVLIGWALTNLTMEGEKSPLISQDVADIWIVLSVMITCSSWAYFS